METVFDQVKAFVKKESYFSFESQGVHGISFSTRDNGSVYDEEPGRADIQEAKRLGKLLREKFPSLNVRMDTCDEWVSIELDNHPKYYSVNTLQKKLEEKGYKTTGACGGTDETVLFTYNGRQMALVSGIGRKLTVCFDCTSQFTPLMHSSKKVEVDLFENFEKVIVDISTGA